MKFPKSENKMLHCCTKAGPYMLALMRIVLGGMFIFAGYAKFGNPSMAIGMLKQLNFPMPEIMSWVLIIAELVCGGLLVLGLLTRLAAIPLIISMIIAFFTVHLKMGFTGPAGVMTWLILLSIISLLVIATDGTKALSLDALICKKHKS